MLSGSYDTIQRRPTTMISTPDSDDIHATEDRRSTSVVDRRAARTILGNPGCRRSHGTSPTDRNSVRHGRWVGTYSNNSQTKKEGCDENRVKDCILHNLTGQEIRAERHSLITRFFSRAIPLGDTISFTPRKEE